MKNALKKWSWDVIFTQLFSQEVEEASKQVTGKVVIVCWWWKFVNQAFQEHWYDICFDESGNRITKSKEEYKLAVDTLLDVTQRLKEQFSHLDNVEIVSSIQETEKWHINRNADEVFLELLSQFSYAFIYTFAWNEEKKRKTFEKHENVEIIAL